MNKIRLCVRAFVRACGTDKTRGRSGIARRRQEGAAWSEKIRKEGVKKGGNCRMGFQEVIRVGSRGPTGSKFTIPVVCF